jgi:hypothetical protein
MRKLPKKLIFDPWKVERLDPGKYGKYLYVRAADYDVLLELYLQAAPCIHCGQILGHHCCKGNKCPEPGRDPSQPMGGFDTKTTFTLPVVTL